MTTAIFIAHQTRENSEEEDEKDEFCIHLDHFYSHFVVCLFLANKAKQLGMPRHEPFLHQFIFAIRLEVLSAAKLLVVVLAKKIRCLLINQGKGR